MAEQSSQYNSLIGKLDSFTRKYYTNQVIRGAIFSAIYVLAFFLAINLMEYYFYLPTTLRKILFFGFIFSSLGFVARYFVTPMLHYYRLGKIISYERAAQIIGTHFSEVKDKLLNILQLRNEAGAQSNTALLFAAIDQKAVELKPVDFSFAVDLSKNKKYLRFLLPPVLLFLFIIIAAPNVIKQGSARLYHNNTVYERQAPFQFVIQNKDLKALQYDNYTLEVKIEGEALPNEVFLESNKNTYKLKKKDKNLFTYEFSNLRQNTEFELNANGFHSKEYTLNVVAKPVVASFEISCFYPPYTGKQNETVKNLGDLIVPAGTRLIWKFNTQNVEELRFLIGDSAYAVKRSGESEFNFTKTFLQSAGYTLKVSNANVKDADSVTYSLNVTPDLYPVVSVNEQHDSSSQKYFYYSGEVSDDYGVRRLTFNYQVTRTDSGAVNESKSMEVPVTAGLASKFTFYWNLQDFAIKPGDKMSYYFEVWDNDGIHGSKSTRSNMMNFQMPTLNELNKEITKDNKELKQDMKETMAKAQKLKNELHDMQDKLQEKKDLNWDDKKNLAQNIEKQKDLQKELENMKNKMDQNFEKQNELNEVKPEIAEKEKRLQDLFDQVMNKEMKDLYDKLQKMLEELQKKDALDKMQDMEANNEKLEKELDRMLELFKKLEFDQKLELTADKLDKLAQKQEDLAKKTDKPQDNKQDGKDAKDKKPGDNKDAKDQKAQNGKDAKDQKDGKDAAKDQKTQEQLKDEQAKLNEELKDAKKDVDDLKKLNEETKSDQDFKDVDKKMDGADKQTADAKQNMDANQNKKASKSQQSAAQDMKEASKSLQAMKAGLEQEEDAEDLQAIRQLLKNILQLSFDEEKLMSDVNQTNINNPKYVDLMHEQQRIRENSKMVEDSLYALAKRQDKISSYITRQINDVNKYLAKAIGDMEDRNKMRAASNEQFVMTGYNNLALMLSEAMQQMQQQMSEQQSKGDPKDGKPKMCMKCNKPGAGKPSLSKMQKQLNDKISQMAEMIKKQGQGKPQNGPGSQGNGMSKEFAEMAQMQAQIRREMEKMNQQEGKDGTKAMGNQAQTAKQMEETEKNLVNKQITAEMISRQQQIMDKLLEAENAERQKDQKQERESHTGKDVKREIPPAIEAYLKAKQSEVDLYKTVPPSLKPYYKNLAEKYFRSLSIQQ